MAEKIPTRLHESIKVNPQIDLVPPFTLERETRKIPIFDRRCEL
ncbi:MAG: hypothetical protein WBY88_09930 [Desulfosarcina sp.]